MSACAYCGANRGHAGWCQLRAEERRQEALRQERLMTLPERASELASKQASDRCMHDQPYVGENACPVCSKAFRQGLEDAALVVENSRGWSVTALATIIRGLKEKR